MLQCKTMKYLVFWVCVCSLKYPACNANAPYCHLWLARLYIIFPHYLNKGTIFVKKNLRSKEFVLVFSTTSVWKISYSRKSWMWHDQKCIFVFIWSTRYSCPILIVLEFSQQIFAIISLSYRNFRYLKYRKM